MSRQITLDTETTGIDPKQGHKIIEIGCLELIDRKLTGRQYHVYLNPQRLVDKAAFRVHGISSEFLQDKPLFKEVMPEFLQFIEGAELIIHNAPFDTGFINSELKQALWKKKLENYCTVLDTLVLARAKHPGQRNNLDALCKRYDVDLSKRTLHGALLDAKILAFVYLAMTGGQSSLFTENSSASKKNSEKIQAPTLPPLINPIVLKASPEELALHQDFLHFLEKKSGVRPSAELELPVVIE